MKLLSKYSVKSTLSIGVLCLCLASSFSFAEHLVDLKVVGVTGAQKTANVNIYVDTINKEERDGSERYQQLVRTAIDKALRAYGYYSSTVTFTLQPAKSSNKPLLIANVDMGQQSIIQSADVTILGEAKDDEVFHDLLRRTAKKGEHVNHLIYENYKSRLQKQLLARGYFDADFEVSRFEIKPSTYQGWWKIVLNSGVRYKFGQFNFAHSQIREDYLRNMMYIKTGDNYFINELSSLTNDYTSSNWFSSVLLEPKIDKERKVVDVNVLLYPRKKNAIDVGIGYSSDVGARFQLSWTKPWINSRGHSFNSNLYISAPRQSLEANYKIPLLKNPQRYYYELSAGFENEETNDTKTTAASFAALRYWNRVTGWQHSFGLRVRYDSFTQANVSDKTLLIYPTASANRTRLKGGLFPTWGDAQRITIDFGNKLWTSDANFFKVQASTTWIRTFEENHRFLMRGEIGWLHTKDINKIPPALRFFAGGDRSVRGYGYKKISPKSAKGKLLGAPRLLTASAEYQYQVMEDWWLATFADTGLAANQFSAKELRYGTGFGVRWASPVGAIKLDIATPIRDKDNSKNIQFYIGLGSEL
ncbi:outer membrane protein assembly factor [Haemophilus haemoglobinophilus]|nr:outer membrane protein assembly factor [Canicola haemoglobinophilus]